MAVSQKVSLTSVSPRPLGLPAGLELLRATGSVTGDVSGGDAAVYFEVNPDLVTVDRYYALVQVLCGVTSTAQAVDVSTGSNQWRDYEHGVSVVIAQETTKYNSFDGASGVEIVKSGSPIYLGAPTTGAAGLLQVRFTSNVDTKVHSMVAYLYACDQPFMVPTFQGA